MYKTRVNGVLCRRWRPKNQPTETCDQVVLPPSYRGCVLKLAHDLPSYRSRVLKLAHDLPMAGHLRRERTLARIRKRFWWPNIVSDMAEYCRTCEECQCCGQRPPRSPLVPMPVIREPFKRIAMDVIGLLPKTAMGKQYVLVVSDYTTRYPEAYALRRFTAPAVAEKLLELFSRHGIPEEILTDQGSNFTSTLLSEIYKLVGTRPIRTTPYHPQTDGLVERFNRTL